MDDKKRALRDTSAPPTMLANPVTASVAFAVARGVPVEKLTEATGMTLDQFIATEARLPESLMPAVWSVIEAHEPGQALTLEMAAAAPLSLFGLVTEAVRQARDVRAALEVFANYQRLLAERLHIAIEDHPKGAFVRLDHPSDAVSGHAAEVGLALGARILWEATGFSRLLVRVDFRHPPLGPLAPYTEFFGAPVRFGTGANGLVIPQRVLVHPLSGDPVRFQALRVHLDAVKQGLRRESDAPELERLSAAIVANAACGEYSAAALARRLGLSLRTLQRLAARLGVSVRTLLSEARAAHARQLLTDPDLALGDIAYVLGYSTESAFRRAFRRWEGTSPGRYRRGLQARS